MTFLPIVERELRVASRKRSTYWLRVAAVLIALVLGTGFMMVSAMGGVGTAHLGGPLFTILTWLALAPAIFAGLFFTSDALSEEKREGTLGFLFLTDLRGYDVAAGKLLATSLRGSFAMLAFFPVLAITLLMGGVTGSEFWKTTLALLNVLFISLSAGLLVSALSRDPQKAMGGTLLLLFILIAGGPIVDTLGQSECLGSPAVLAFDADE
jgi:ABC-type transport system involved in multi-copper enzyme maturation permease subunit